MERYNKKLLWLLLSTLSSGVVSFEICRSFITCEDPFMMYLLTLSCVASVAVTLLLSYLTIKHMINE